MGGKERYSLGEKLSLNTELEVTWAASSLKVRKTDSEDLNLILLKFIWFGFTMRLDVGMLV